jgi:hypothetical protein
MTPTPIKREKVESVIQTGRKREGEYCTPALLTTLSLFSNSCVEAILDEIGEKGERKEGIGVGEGQVELYVGYI